MKISKWMKGFLSFLLSFTVMFTTMIQQNTVLADEGSIDPAEVIDEEMPASSPEAEATPAASEPVATPVALETAEPTVQPDETPAVQEADVQTESTPAEAPQAATAQPVETQEEAYVSPTSFDAETDNIKVHAETAEGAFNEPVTLVVNVLDEDTEDYKKVRETMDQNGSSQDGMLALDIRFENSSNQEVEPNGQVSISVVIKDAANEDIDQSSLQVTHLKEEDDGTLTLEKVADNDQNTDGYIRTADNNIEADFTAENFSVYAFSYERDTGRKEETSPSPEPTPESTADNLQAAVSYAAGTAKSLTTRETVDSKSKGFHIYMVDMAYPWETTTGAYKNNDGRLSQGIYKNTLTNDYPEFLYSSKSLAEEFSRAREVNHLFYKDTYDKTGYFYYSSAETFASLQRNGNFLVSQELGSPSGIDAFYFKRGNFFPYNTLNLRRVISRNLYDDQGKLLSPNADRYNEALYGMKEEVNYGFGLHAKAEFYQPVDGIVNGNQNMVYEFTGDDDMLVYIDGVLVLDLGGIHDAQSGTINFHTGEVTFTNIFTDKNNKIDYGSSTTIYDQYESAGRLGTTTWSGKTFAAGTSHKIDIFYMERGAGASNLKMKVNIPPVPDGTVAVSKQVEGLDATQAANETYTMKLMIDGSAAANAEYTLSDDPKTTLKADENGQFQLKAGQTALFSGIGAGKTVKVDEIVGQDTIYRVSYQRYDSNNNEITDSKDTITVPSAGHVAVTVKNNAAEHTNNLTITKQFMMNGQDVSRVINMDAFQNATFTLQESKDNGSKWKDLYTISYSSFQNNSYTFSQLDPRSQYRVIENLTETTNGSNVSYSYNDTVSSFDGTNGNTTSPVISLRDGDAAVIFTNNYGTQTYPLTIRKSFDGIESLPSNFQITIDGSTEVFTVANKKGGSGTAEDPYWWSTDAAYNSTLTIRESGYETDNYQLAAGTETSRQITIRSDSNVVEFENHYVPKTYRFTLVKKFVGITKDEKPQNFQIEGNGRTYVLGDGTPSEDGLTYTWTDSAAYGSTLTFTESNANVTGYSLTASNNGIASLTIASSGNRAEITNTYTPKDYTVTVTKVFEGLDSDADFSNFEMQANVNSVVTAKKISDASGDGTASNPYTWTFEAPYKSMVTFEEANYQIKGFSRTNNDATTKSITVSASNEINKVSFTNVYQKNTGEDVNELPTLNILKKDNKGNALSQAEFTLFDPDGNAIWHDVTNTEGKLSVDFSKYTFSANQTSYQFTLKETNAPTGYTASSETYTFTVNLKDGDPEIKYDSANNWFQNFYHWIVGNRSSASYDAASSTLTVVNTINQYTYKIVKTFSGVNDLPDTFVITDQNGRRYTLKDATKQGNTYTWTGTADYDTEFRLTESGMDIHGYNLASTVNGQIETSGTLKVTAEEKNNVITFSNTYTAQSRSVTVTKQFNGLTDEEVPTGFAITGLGENLTLANAEKTGDFTYQWTRDVAYGTNLTLSETGYAVSGYQVAAAVNGNPGTGIELTVGDDNNISFINSYDKKYSEDDDVHTPSFTIHKVDQDDKLLAGATFTLTDSNNKVVWTGTTDGENDLTADFANFDFGTDPSAKFNFTLHEDAPVGYTGAEDWTITVSEDDGVVSFRKESDEDFFHKIFNWLIKDSFDKAYDQTSKVLTVTNTVNSYDFTVTKSFTGVEALPEDFQITDSLGNVYKLDDAKSANGTYTWTGKADYGTKVTFTENGYQVNGYDVTTSVNGKDGTSAEITIGTSNNNVDFVNSYEAGTYMVRVTKSFTGVDELPDTFAITGAGENALTAADAVSGTGTADDPYVWNVEAKFGTILNIAETGYETEGYDVTSTVNGNAGTSMQIQVGTGSNNVTFNNAYSLKKTDVVLSAEKNLIGRDLKAGEFNFEAYEGDQLVAEGTNDADGNIVFSTIHDVTYGTHTYTLKEVDQGLGGMTYDDNAYEVTVEVIDQDGTAKAVLPETKPVFTNTYSAQDGSAVIEARKNLTGRDAQNGEFSFELVQDGKTIATAVNEDGKVVFGPISWTMDEIGTYTYSIREVAGTDANIVYDSHEETVTVTVSDNGDGTLHIEVAYDEDGAVFNNTYEPTVPHTDDDNPKPSPTPSSDPAPLPAVPSTSDNGKPTSNSSKTPQTGVNSDVTTWVWLGSSSLLALFIALILRRRKEESK
ncbi:MAG: FctA domain-containing protein [Erysipelotrichaceae bacterium]|nr:FctA domain-containing protein [Erysipelotrichaceae bacterium]